MFENFKKLDAFVWVNEKISTLFFCFLKLRNLRNDSGAVCLVLSSGRFMESDYIRDYEDFKLFEST